MSEISREAILHIPKSNYAYGYDKETLHIRLRTKKGEVKKVKLRAGDPYIWDFGGAGGGNLNSSGRGWVGGSIIPMKKELETEYFDYWFVSHKPLNKRCRYCFVVESEYEKLLYTEKGIYELGKEKDEERLSCISTFFGYPYLNGADIGEVPKWVKDIIWYQIFPDRFANADTTINPEGTQPWGSKPTPYNFTGGDLQGVIDNLDYLQNLGITGIYFCPITQARTNHRYDTIDYMKIDPTLGNEETLRTLVKEAHKRGMKVMLDAVFNHIGYYSKQWQDVIKNKEKSRYKDWFYIKTFEGIDAPLEEIDNRNLPYETFADVAHMPKLNTENTEVMQHLIEVGKYWIREFDIDAWRLDVSNEVDHKFWRKLRQELKELKPDVYILGEIWHNSLPWLMGDQFDSVMNYPLGEAIRDFFCTNEIHSEKFKYMINDVIVSYPMHVNEVTFNLLGSHDTTRILSYANENKDKFKLAYLFMFTQAGSPCIYYGDEIGMKGIQEPGCDMQRQCMIWDEEKQDKEILQFMQKIIKLRKNTDEFKLASNDWITAHKETGLVIFKKEDVTIILNNSQEERLVNLPKYLQNKEVTDLFEEEKITLKDSINMNAYDFKLLKNIY